MNHSFHALYTFTKIEIGSARRLAKLGQKQTAIGILRFIENSQILRLLKAQEFPGFLNVDVSLLEWELKEAISECHPDSQTGAGVDVLTGIHAKLEVIAHYVAGGSK